MNDERDTPGWDVGGRDPAEGLGFPNSGLPEGFIDYNAAIPTTQDWSDGALDAFARKLSKTWKDVPTPAKFVVSAIIGSGIGTVINGIEMFKEDEATRSNMINNIVQEHPEISIKQASDMVQDMIDKGWENWAKENHIPGEIGEMTGRQILTSIGTEKPNYGKWWEIKGAKSTWGWPDKEGKLTFPNTNFAGTWIKTPDGKQFQFEDWMTEHPEYSGTITWNTGQKTYPWDSADPRNKAWKAGGYTRNDDGTISTGDGGNGGSGTGDDGLPGYLTYWKPDNQTGKQGGLLGYNKSNQTGASDPVEAYFKRYPEAETEYQRMVGVNPNWGKEGGREAWAKANYEERKAAGQDVVWGLLEGEEGGGEGDKNEDKGFVVPESWLTYREDPTPENAENALMDFFMQMYENPNLQPKQVMDEFYNLATETKGKLDEIGATAKGYREDYTTEMDKISGMRGPTISFGGKPVQTASGEALEVRPKKTMATLTGIQKEKLSGGLLGLDTEAQAQRNKLGTQGLLIDTAIKPLYNMWNTLYSGRTGKEQATAVADINNPNLSWWERLLPAAGAAAGSQGFWDWVSG